MIRTGCRKTADGYCAPLQRHATTWHFKNIGFRRRQSPLTDRHRARVVTISSSSLRRGHDVYRSSAWHAEAAQRPREMPGRIPGKSRKIDIKRAAACFRLSRYFGAKARQQTSTPHVASAGTRHYRHERMRGLL